MNVTRSPSPTPSLTGKRNRKQNRSHSAGVYHDLTRSAPSTWRSRFSNPLRRSSRRSSNASDTTITSVDAEGDESEIEYESAQVLPVIRTRAVKPEPPKLVNIRGCGSGRKAGEDKANPKQSKKLLEYYGVEQGDEAKARHERMRSLRRERRSLFREEFGFGSEALPWGAGGQEGTVRAEQAVNGGLGEGLMKWYRCDLFPANATDFHLAEKEAKRLVTAARGKVMEGWTYPGGFMFQIPHNIPSPLPPTSAATAPDLDALLGLTGIVRVTEFQPHLNPMQHLLQLASSSPQPSSGEATPTNNRPTTASSDSTPDMITAFDYITEVEEVPLLRISPRKAEHGDPSWRNTISPVKKRKLHRWLETQRSMQRRKHAHELDGKELSRRDATEESPRRYSAKESPKRGVKTSPRREVWLTKNGGTKLDALEEGDEDEWVSDDSSGSEYSGGDGSESEWEGEAGEAKSDGEVSVATGLESLKFVADFGSLF